MASKHFPPFFFHSLFLIFRICISSLSNLDFINPVETFHILIFYDIFTNSIFSLWNLLNNHAPINSNTIINTICIIPSQPFGSEELEYEWNNTYWYSRRLNKSINFHKSQFHIIPHHQIKKKIQNNTFSHFVLIQLLIIFRYRRHTIAYNSKQYLLC